MREMTWLDLGHNRIGAAGAASLAPSLAQMRRLKPEYLSLSGNAIGDAGATSLAPSLAKMTELTSLVLRHNCIGGEAGLASLAPSLALIAGDRSMSIYRLGYCSATALSTPSPADRRCRRHRPTGHRRHARRPPRTRSWPSKYRVSAGRRVTEYTTH